MKLDNCISIRPVFFLRLQPATQGLPRSNEAAQRGMTMILDFWIFSEGVVHRASVPLCLDACWNQFPVLFCELEVENFFSRWSRRSTAQQRSRRRSSNDDKGSLTRRAHSAC